MKRKSKQIVSVVVGLVLVVAVLAGIKAAQVRAMIKAGAAFVPPPEAVTSATVQTAQWQQARTAVGSMVAVHGVTMAAEVTGTVRQIAFESGAVVKKDDLLVRLDTSVETAQLQAAEAQAALARLTLQRVESLRGSDAMSPADFDSAQAQAQQADALVANAKAAIAKKIIRAPFAGRLGIRQVELGQVVAPGAPIVTLQSFDPMYAEFWLPQQALSEVRLEQAVRLRSDTFPGEVWEGKVTTINPEVDPNTRNVRLRATVANQDGRLHPGMFVQVEVLSPQVEQVLAIPATAVLHAPYGDSVFVLNEQKDASGATSLVAEQTFVRLGERRGDLVAVISGLKEGQVVASSGAFKLRNGASVVVNNKLAPEAVETPNPSDQ